MALISCPECGKEISDKVTVCPYCGYPFPDNQPKQDIPQPVAVTSVNIGPADPVKKKSMLTGIICAVVTVIAVIIAINVHNSIKKENERTQYLENITSIHTLMLDGGVKAEGLCNLTRKVWYNTIYKKYDSETDPYTKDMLNYFYEDFNTSLNNLYKADSTITTISNIKANQEQVSEMIKSLQNPSEEFSTCYDTLDNLYDAYKGLTELAISPSGNLNSYTERFRNYDDDFILYYDKLKTLIPEK